MFRKITPLRVLTVGLLLSFILYYYFNSVKQESLVIRLHEDQVEVQKLVNAFTRIIIEEGYGFRVQLVESTIKEVQERLLRGDVDVTMEMWKQNNLLWYKEGLKRGRLIDLGILYSSGQQYWIVSRRYAEENGITSVFDMRNHWQDFVDPADPSKGIFFNCVFGWACSDINNVKLKVYGLDRYYNSVSPLSPESLKAVYEKAHARNLPVFGYYWEPNALMEDKDWYVLEEPEYKEEVWEQVIHASIDPKAEIPHQACGYNESGVYKIASIGLSAKAPEIVKMLAAMEVDVQVIKDILFTSELRNEKLYADLARKFLEDYPAMWSGWVTEEARLKIEKALAESSATDL